MAESTYRRPGSEARHVRELVIDKLPSALRERLALCLTRDGAPLPLLVDASPRALLSAGHAMLLAVVATIVEVALWPTGFGDVDSPHAMEPLAFAAAHGAAIFTLLVAVVCAARLSRSPGNTPFPEGRYLFALTLVEVVGVRVRVTELHTLRRVDVRSGRRGPSIVLVFGDAHEVVFAAQPSAEPLAASVKAAVDAAAELVLPDDQPRLSRLDPFFELRVSNDWASAEADAPEPRSRLVRARIEALAAAILATSALAGLGLHALRNRLSDDEMFARAIAIVPGASTQIAGASATTRACGTKATSTRCASIARAATRTRWRSTCSSRARTCARRSKSSSTSRNRRSTRSAPTSWPAALAPLRRTICSSRRSEAPAIPRATGSISATGSAISTRCSACSSPRRSTSTR